MGIYSNPEFWCYYDNTKETYYPVNENDDIVLFDESNNPTVSEIYIGSIFLTEKYLNESKLQIGTIELNDKYGGNFDVYIKGSEGPYPHFHLICCGKNLPECCIMLLDNMFFDHGVSSLTLPSNKVGKVINKFLNSKNKKNHTMTNYEYMMLSYATVLNNQIPRYLTYNEFVTYPKPNYTSIKPYNKKVLNNDISMVINRIIVDDE